MSANLQKTIIQIFGSILFGYGAFALASGGSSVHAVPSPPDVASDIADEAR